MKGPAFAGAFVLIVAASIAAPGQEAWTPSPEDVLLSAVLSRDKPKVEALLKQGASPDARNKENDRTALFFAAEMGDLAMVDLLLRHGADVGARDKMHGERPIGAASRSGHVDVVKLLLAKDTNSDAADRVAWNGVFQRNVPMLDAALETRRLSADTLSFLLDEADRGGATDVADRLKKAGAVPPKPITLPQPDLARLAGSYRTEDKARSLAVSLVDGGLMGTLDGASHAFVPLDPTFFVREGHRFPTLRFEVGGDTAAVTVRGDGEWTRYTRVVP